LGRSEKIVAREGPSLESNCRNFATLNFWSLLFPPY